MMIRSWNSLLKSAFEWRHYRALINMLAIYNAPLKMVRTYLAGRGTFPCIVPIQTPIGPLRIMLYSFHDFLTLNEIFCRKDYGSHTNHLKCVLDLGSNIGISILYFLSRNDNVKVYGYEPVPENAKKLCEQIQANHLETRLHFYEEAVCDFSGRSQFGVEITGRYGGIDKNFPKKIDVQCADINHVIENILIKENYIDILKIDTEGTEKRIFEAIDSDLCKRIHLIYVEDGWSDHKSNLFKAKRYGNITIFKNRNCS